jgi:hypothetical protein
MATRSKQLAAGSSTAALGNQTVVYTVPAGSTTIVKDATLANEGAAAQSYNFSIFTAGGIQIFLAAVTSAAQYTITHWEGWAVAEAGDRVCVGCTAAGLEYLISGAELVG